MYVGPVDASQEKIPIISNDRLELETKTLSIGLNKIFGEVLDNAFDEAKRCSAAGKPMSSIRIEVNSKTNEIRVTDTGHGFYNGTEINKATGITNIETAVSCLRAGSNFDNDDTDVNLIGTNGVGVACTNVLSDTFTIVTVNTTHYFEKTWTKFESKETAIRNKRASEKTGTTITFIPRKSVFKGMKWDFDYIRSNVSFRKFINDLDPNLVNLNLHLYWDGKKVNLESFVPNDALVMTGKLGYLAIWKAFPNSTRVSFVNGAMCTGIHEKIVQDNLNELLGYEKAHQFYEWAYVLNLPPKYVRFGDQNKTKFATGRGEVEDLIITGLLRKNFKKFINSQLFEELIEEIEALTHAHELKKLKSAKRQSKMKISDKYFPGSTDKENLFIVEGVSARGSILQARNPNTDGVYSLKGKIKNTRTLADLSTNAEIIDLMNILDLHVEDRGKKCTYKKIIIATDADGDGYHISSLLINFFHSWFPEVIRSNKLHILNVPLASTGSTKRTYYYAVGNVPNTSGTRYLKGLGSMDLKDWTYVFSNMSLNKVVEDKSTHRLLDIAFGTNVEKRKKWLQS